MKKPYRIIGLIVTGVVLASAVGLYFDARKRRHLQNRLATAAEEGYEVAHDIIYPGDNTRGRKKKLRYGPVF